MKKALWLSCSKFTIGVEHTNGIITYASPIAYKFIGQPIENLRRWMKKLGGYREAELKQE